MSGARDGRAFLAATIARGLVGRVARALAAEGVRVMPLKGVVLHALVYDDPAERVISDVDLLVEPARFDEARRALAAAGFREEARTPWAVTLAAANAPLGVDLHRHLYPPGLFAMDTAGVFARARRDEGLFGAPVWIPDRYDLYAHAVGHFAKTRMDDRNPRTFVDLARIAARLELDARACAAHLHALGLGRAARYTLAFAAKDDRFARAVLRALPRDPVGDALARAARAIARRCDQPSPASAPAAHLVNRTLPAGIISFAAQIAGAARL